MTYLLVGTASCLSHACLSGVLQRSPWPSATFFDAPGDVGYCVRRYDESENPRLNSDTSGASSDYVWHKDIGRCCRLILLQVFVARALVRCSPRPSFAL